MSLLDIVEEEFGAAGRGSKGSKSAKSTLKDLKDLKEPQPKRSELREAAGVSPAIEPATPVRKVGDFLRPVQCVDMLARKLWREHYDELEQQAGDSWALISIDPDKLMDFAHHEATRRILKDGRMPDTFTSEAHCRKCGLVPVDEGLSDEISECPWCMNGLTAPAIPGRDK